MRSGFRHIESCNGIWKEKPILRLLSDMHKRQREKDLLEEEKEIRDKFNPK